MTRITERAEFAGTRNDEQHRYRTTTRRALEIEGRLGLRSGLPSPISGQNEGTDRVANPKRDPKGRVRAGEGTRRATLRVLRDGGARPSRRILAAEHRGRPEGRPPSGSASEALPIKVAPGELAVGRKDERRGDA